MPDSTQEFVRTLTAGEFQRQCFEEILDFLKLLRIKESEKSTFTKREPTELLTYLSIPELYKKCKEQLDELLEMFPRLRDEIKEDMREILECLYADQKGSHLGFCLSRSGNLRVQG